MELVNFFSFDVEKQPVDDFEKLREGISSFSILKKLVYPIDWIVGISISFSFDALMALVESIKPVLIEAGRMFVIKLTKGNHFSDHLLLHDGKLIVMKFGIFDEEEVNFVRN